ncbi:A/G-specific adenine glycosylase [Candidatus Latescibacterota bacterium]
MNLTKSQIKKFQTDIYAYYKEHGRDLPWRKTTDPYRILISEIMLQQTQVPRVVPAYERFITVFPDIRSLADVDLRSILREWKGLGYNRRAKMLKDMAAEIVARFDGVIPPDEATLRSLPGIGPYTANAVRAFAFNLPAVFIETNIRSVFIHFFFKDSAGVKDSEILPLVAQTLDTDNPREWYYALMDYGVFLKQTGENPSRSSAHYTKQSRFQGSDRQIRGKILELLLEHENLTETELCARFDSDPERTKNIIARLVKEGILVNDRYLSIA